MLQSLGGTDVDDHPYDVCYFGARDPCGYL